jgi:hypothetical protein
MTLIDDKSVKDFQSLRRFSLWHVPLSRCTISKNLSSQYGGVIMKELKERIQKAGQVLGNGILKVDSFINHQVGICKTLRECRRDQDPYC